MGIPSLPQGPGGIGLEIAGEVMQAAVSIVVIHLEHVRRIINAGQPAQIMRDARTIARWAITRSDDLHWPQSDAVGPTQIITPTRSCVTSFVAPTR